jgi:PIN domain nuclease of toxin-antitoxin system
LAESGVAVSVASLWELVVKSGRKDALLQDPLPWWEKDVVKSGIPMLAIRRSQVMALGRLRELHKDPFDRILWRKLSSRKCHWRPRMTYFTNTA